MKRNITLSLDINIYQDTKSKVKNVSAFVEKLLTESLNAKEESPINLKDDIEELEMRLAAKKALLEETRVKEEGGVTWEKSSDTYSE